MPRKQSFLRRGLRRGQKKPAPPNCCKPRQPKDSIHIAQLSPTMDLYVKRDSQVEAAEEDLQHVDPADHGTMFALLTQHGHGEFFVQERKLDGTITIHRFEVVPRNQKPAQLEPGVILPQSSPDVRAYVKQLDTQLAPQGFIVQEIPV